MEKPRGKQEVDQAVIKAFLYDWGIDNPDKFLADLDDIGYVVLPRVSDNEMRVAGARAIRDTMDNSPNFAERARQCWAEMIQAYEGENHD